MKKSLTLFILILLSYALHAGALDVNIIQGNRSKTVNMMLSCGEVKIAMKLHQNERGLFSLDLGRSCVFDNGSFTAGEIRMGQSSLHHVNTPSSKPSFMGLGWFSDDADFAILTRPVGTALFLRGKKARLGLVFYDSTGNEREAEYDWMMDWKSDIAKGKTLKGTLKLKAKQSDYTADVIINSLTGFSYSDELVIRISSLTFSHLRGDEDLMKVSLSFEDENIRETVSYSKTTGKPPVYGGMATSALFTFSHRLETGLFSFESKSSVEYRKDTGISKRTDYLISHDKMTLGLVFERTQGVRNGFRSPSLSIKTESLSLLVEKGKAHIDISKTVMGEKISIGLHITEKRLYSIFIRYGF